MEPSSTSLRWLVERLRSSQRPTSPLSGINRYRVWSYVVWSSSTRYPEGIRVWIVSGPQAVFDNEFLTWESAYRYALASASHPVKPMPNDFINENRYD